MVAGGVALIIGMLAVLGFSGGVSDGHGPGIPQRTTP